MRAAAVPYHSSGQSLSTSWSIRMSPGSVSCLYCTDHCALTSSSFVAESPWLEVAARNTTPGPCGCTLNPSGCPSRSGPRRTRKGFTVSCSAFSNTRTSGHVSLRAPSGLLSYCRARLDVVSGCSRVFQQLACHSSVLMIFHSVPRASAARCIDFATSAYLAGETLSSGSGKPGMAWHLSHWSM